MHHVCVLAADIGESLTTAAVEENGTSTAVEESVTVATVTAGEYCGDCNSIVSHHNLHPPSIVTERKNESKTRGVYMCKCIF